MEDWYHGSPLELTILRAGSTITRDRHLAEVFSHKPQIVSIADDGALRHNGAQPGWLYVIDEAITPDDVYPHPRTTMPAGWEWLTRRELRLRLLGAAALKREECLTEEALAELRARARSRFATGG